MARTARAAASSLQEDTTIYQDDSETGRSPTPATSDKENHQARGAGSARRKRGHTQTMTSNSRASASKRQRLGNRASNIQPSQSQIPMSQADRDRRYYDPDQDEGERRKIRKGLRDLTRDLHDSRSEYLQAGNHGIRNTIFKANNIFEHVKQTSDATIDSRLLVTAADLSHKKTAQLALGDVTAGIDVDEFVSKCITFMRRGPQDSQNSPPTSTQRRRNRASGGRSQADPDDSDDEGEGMNWDWLGRAACFRHNARPSVSGFLLGPLSVQKRTRVMTQRRARERIDPSQAVRPQELQEEDLDQRETANLTTMCKKINTLLAKTVQSAEDNANRELSELDEEPTEEILHQVMEKYNICDDGGVSLFRFCINPRSFGQTVENLFYLSFLVRDGIVGVSEDSQGLPTLHPSKPYAPIEAQRKGIQKHQAVFSLDFDTWHNLIEVFNISEPIVPHRNEDESQNTNRRGWYG